LLHLGLDFEVIIEHPEDDGRASIPRKNQGLKIPRLSLPSLLYIFGYYRNTDIPKDVPGIF
jgi:hypothetical protein